MNNTTLGMHNRAIQSYYRWHAPVYNISRWSFLFGRNRLIKNIPKLPPQPRILEVGCGTGRNITLLQRRFPEAEITGLDVSPKMLRIASKKVDGSVRLSNNSFNEYDHPQKPYDLILLSYSLTMMYAPPKTVIEQLYNQLSQNGIIAVVDFDNTPYDWFRRWMAKNHVQLNGNICPALKSHFTPVHYTKKTAYFGLWTYYIFTGTK